MTNVREWSLNLLDWEARYVLSSIVREMDRLKAIAEGSEDEDERADAGNDYLEIAGLKQRLESDAKAVFGAQIVEFEDRKL